MLTRIWTGTLLLAVAAYRSTVVEELDRFSQICADVIKAPVGLLENVEHGREYGLDQRILGRKVAVEECLGDAETTGQLAGAATEFETYLKLAPDGPNAATAKSLVAQLKK